MGKKSAIANRCHKLHMTMPPQCSFLHLRHIGIGSEKGSGTIAHERLKFHTIDFLFLHTLEGIFRRYLSIFPYFGGAHIFLHQVLHRPCQAVVKRRHRRFWNCPQFHHHPGRSTHIAHRVSSHQMRKARSSTAIRDDQCTVFPCVCIQNHKVFFKERNTDCADASFYSCLKQWIGPD